ncbi:MAG: hypothetical protein Q8941_05690 [Bacteroidota bacterium]|nr:hypothetical protein [Bacteroidota bacterium]
MEYMFIDFDLETTEITGRLKHVEGYLDCEKIIISNVRKLLDHDLTDENIILYLKKLSAWLTNALETSQGNADHTNYRYAAGFVDTLLKMPYWKSWMKTIDI